MAAGDMTATYEHTRGRVIQHTLVTITSETNGVSPTGGTLDTNEIPYGIYAGSMFGKVENRVAPHNLQVNLKSGNLTIGNDNKNQIITIIPYAVVNDPDGFPEVRLFDALAEGETFSGAYAGGVTLSTNELGFWIGCDEALETGSTLTLYLSLFSHVLDQ